MSRCIKSVENQFHATAANGQLVSPAGTTGRSSPPVHHPGPVDRRHRHVTSSDKYPHGQASSSHLLRPFTGLQDLRPMMDSYVMNIGSTTTISPKQLRWSLSAELRTVIALRGLFIVPVRTPCHEILTWHAIFHKPSKRLRKAQKHSPHRLSRSEWSGKVLRDLSFFGHSQSIIGTQNGLSTGIVHRHSG